jgi:hypothetical protein
MYIIIRKIVKSNLDISMKRVELFQTKTLFSWNGQLYKQTDGVPMSSPHDPTLANIIMTEFEELYFC